MCYYQEFSIFCHQAKYYTLYKKGRQLLGGLNNQCWHANELNKKFKENCINLDHCVKVTEVQQLSEFI